MIQFKQEMNMPLLFDLRSGIPYSNRKLLKMLLRHKSVSLNSYPYPRFIPSGTTRGAILDRVLTMRFTV